MFVGLIRKTRRVRPGSKDEFAVACCPAEVEEARSTANEIRGGESGSESWREAASWRFFEKLVPAPTTEVLFL